MFLVNPNISEADHMVIDSGRVSVLWEDAARVCGNIAEMLIIIRVKIVVMIIFPVPAFSSIRLDDSLYSSCMMDVLVDFAELLDFDVLFSSNTVATTMDRHLILITEDEGSNMENMFLIISSLFLFVLFLGTYGV